MDTFKYELGSKGKCKITGYEGMIVARTEWLHGCRRYVLQSAKLQDSGKPAEPLAIDEDGLELITPAEPHKMAGTGGDAPMPTRQAEAGRHG